MVIYVQMYSLFIVPSWVIVNYINSIAIVKYINSIPNKTSSLTKICKLDVNCFILIIKKLKSNHFTEKEILKRLIVVKVIT